MGEKIKLESLELERLNTILVNTLIEKKVLKTPRIIAAFQAVKRSDFVAFENLQDAFLDVPLGIGFSQTISQPTTVAIMLENLDPFEGASVLDIGSGSGWTTALLAQIVGPQGKVLGLERIPELVEQGKRNLEKYEERNASIELADPKKLGVPGQVFDRILVSAAATHIPIDLFDQLSDRDGKMVIPVNNTLGTFKKTQAGITKNDQKGFLFVPLKGDY